MPYRPILACCAFLLGPVAARAADPSLESRAVVRDNGLEGTWSVDCGQKPSVHNRRVRWVVPAQGPVEQWVDFGDGYEYVASVRSAAAEAGRLTLSVTTESGWSWVGTSLRVGDKLREFDMVDTYRGQSTATVANGHDLTTDRQTPLIEKCMDEPAV